MVKRFSICAVAPLFAVLGACGEAGEVYPLPAREVRQTLRAIMLPVPLGFSASTRAIDKGDGSIVWPVKKDGKTMMRYVARTEKVDAGHTRVVVELLPPTDSPDDPMTQRFEELSGFREAFLIAMVEQIDAKLEKRPYDYSKTARATAFAIQSDFDEISAMMDEEAARAQQDYASNMADAYGSEGSRWSDDSSEPAFGEPMDDGSPGTN